MPLAIIPDGVRKLSEKWRQRVADRREVSDVDPAADAFAKAATELEAEIIAADAAWCLEPMHRTYVVDLATFQRIKEHEFLTEGSSGDPE